MTIGYNEVEEGTIPLHQLNPRSRATSRRGQHPGGRRSFDENFFRSCAEIHRFLLRGRLPGHEPTHHRKRSGLGPQPRQGGRHHRQYPVPLCRPPPSTPATKAKTPSTPASTATAARTRVLRSSRPSPPHSATLSTLLVIDYL